MFLTDFNLLDLNYLDLNYLVRKNDGSNDKANPDVRVRQVGFAAGYCCWADGPPSGVA